MPRPSVLILMDYYLPAFRAGGPVRSIANLTERLAAEYEFSILCRDRDIGDDAPFEDAPCGTWMRCGAGRVRYLAPGELTLRGLRSAVHSRPHDLAYLNSLFSPLTRTYLMLRRLRAVPRVPVVLAPHGELRPGALARKPRRKAAWLRWMRLAGLGRGVVWQATSPQEAEEIAVHAGTAVRVADNLAAAGDAGLAAEAGPPPKRPGEARLVFLSRVVPNKNLDFALRLLARTAGRIDFDVYGTAEDPRYLEACRQLAANLPEHVTCRFHGPVPPAAVPATLAGYHGFLFPSRHENFGYVILEALLAGLPVVTSDQTYWRDLERAGAGWDVPLADESRLLAALQRLIDLDEDGYRRLSAGARAHGQRYVDDPALLQRYRDLFRAAGLKTA